MGSFSTKASTDSDHGASDSDDEHLWTMTTMYVRAAAFFSPSSAIPAIFSMKLIALLPITILAVDAVVASTVPARLHHRIARTLRLPRPPQT